MSPLYFPDAVRRLRNAGCQVYHHDNGSLVATHGTWTDGFPRDPKARTYDAAAIDAFVAEVRAADKRDLALS